MFLRPVNGATFSLLYTSVRPQCIWNRCKSWLVNAAFPQDVEIVIATDASDKASEMAAALASRSLSRCAIKRVSVLEKAGNCVKGWNAAAAFSSGDVLVQISDDFSPPPNWDLDLVLLKCACHESSWWKHDHAVHVNDGYTGQIMTLAILTRKRYKLQGFFYYPSYESMFCDTDLTGSAYKDGVVIDARHLLFRHHHYNCNTRPRDRSDQAHNSSARWRSGQILFEARKAAGFPKDRKSSVSTKLLV